MFDPPRRSFLSAFRRKDETAPDTGERLLTEGARAGHYVIGAELGSGGMGVVYRAHDTRLDRPVALKFLPPHLMADEEATRRLLVEARAAARLDHPNICTIHEIGSLPDGRSFIAMAHYEGETVKQRIGDRRELAPEDAAATADGVARGLGHAHAAGIIHRDIKPGNIFLAEDGRVKILDFGIAKISGVELTAEGAALGTVAYMSPEQIRAEAVDARTDLWSLGVVLYEMCCGERPFIGADRVAVLHGILELDPPPLDRMIPGFPPGLWRIVVRCLEKDPAKRFADTAALIEALDFCLDPAETGDEVSAPAPSLSAEGERRQATVLSARLAGRGALEELLPPKEVDALLTSCGETMASAVTGFGGVVNRNSGRALEALFGIPVSREDDAVRAVRAATEVCRRVDELLAERGCEGAIGIRCGVDSGRVVARRDGEGDSEYRVVGDAAELSARLAGQAGVGEVLVSESCRRIVAPFFEAGRIGTLRREDDEETETFRITGETGARSRLEAAAEGEGLTALSGREAELGILLEAGRGAAAGEGRFVSVVGDAGAGKSRLLYEFEKRLDGSRLRIIHGRCQSFGSEVPYLPFIDALRDLLKLSDVGGATTPELVTERVRAVSPELEDFIPYYLQLLSVSEPEPDRREEGIEGPEVWAGEQHRVGLVESLSALFTLGAEDRPTVALLEDWHWADTASRQVLDQLLEMVSAYPLLIVAAARPEGDLEWGAIPDHTPIVLGPLAPEDSDAIVRSTMRADEAPPALTRLLHDRTGGNPFFLEEVCRALSEEGILEVQRGRVIVAGPLDNLELPDTVHGVLRSRLDRLDGATRRLVRYAAVVGREFPLDVLRHALDAGPGIADDLDRLRKLGLIQQIRVVPTPTYRFKHALTQDVAYDGLLERQRAEIHGAVGDALEALRPDRLDDHLDRLAEHFAVAERWRKAVDYAVAATDKRWAFSEFSEAVEAQSRALEWVGRLDDPEERFERRIDLLLRHERLHEFLGLRDRQQEIIEELLEMLDPERHPERIAVTHVRQGDLCILTREPEAAEQSLERALGLAREIGDTSIERHALRSLGLLRWHQQRPEDAIEFVERALELDRGLDNLEAVVGNLANLGALYRALGQLDRALECLHEALELERSIERRNAGLVVKESYILHSIAITHSRLGDGAKAREYAAAAKESVESKSAVFNVVQMHYHLNTLARFHIEEGNLDEGLALYDESVGLCRRTRHLEGLSTSLRVRGEVLLNLQRYDDAMPDLREAGELFTRMRDIPSAAGMWRGVATAREALGDAEGALEAWRTARELAEGLADPSLAIEATEGTARLLRERDPAASLKAYEEVLERSDGGPAVAGRLRYRIGVLRWQFGAYADALDSFERAYADLSEGGDRAHAGLALNSIGRTLRDLGRLEEAAERLESSIELNERNHEPLLVAHAASTLGDVLLDAGDANGAIERFEKSLEIRRSLEDSGLGWAHYGLARAHLAAGSSDGAAYYLGEADDVASRSGDRDLLERCAELRTNLPS